MAEGIVFPPGTRDGPCEPPCAHVDCQEMRKTAESPCSICRKPIGYETGYYVHNKQLVHADCLESQVTGPPTKAPPTG
jgi:hypothetical protein